MEHIVKLLTQKKKTIATMESCTGGALVNAITNIEGASNVIKFSAVTYSNEYKIKMGVPKQTIDTYTVYSIEVAKEMSKVITTFANSDYGVGITGKLNRVDENNLVGKDNFVFISIYEKETDTFHTMTVEVPKESREKNKNYLISCIENELERILK